jgi:hypothetical protein
MPTISKALFRGAASTSNTTLYTVPSSTTAIVTNIVIDNTSASEQTVTINLNGVALISAAPVAANASVFFDLKQTLTATQTITGSAAATSVNFHISGVEIA